MRFESLIAQSGGASESYCDAQLMREFDAMPLVVLRRRDEAAHDVALHVDVAALQFESPHCNPSSSASVPVRSSLNSHGYASMVAHSLRVSGRMSGASSSACRRYLPMRSVGWVYDSRSPERGESR